jgi:hypothetical protein
MELGKIMKIIIEPKRFKSFLENAMMYKTNKPIIDPGVFLFEKDKVTTRGVYINSIGTYQEYQKSFFLSYESEEEIVAVPKLIPEILNWGFDTGNLEIETDKSRMFVKNKDEKGNVISSMDESLGNSEIQEMPKNFSKFEKTEYGLMPNKIEKPESVFELSKKDLFLPPVKEYIFTYMDGKLTLSAKKGNFSKEVPGRSILKKDVKVIIDSEYFETILANVDDKINLIFDDDVLIVTENKKDYNKTFFMGVNNE